MARNVSAVKPKGKKAAGAIARVVARPSKEVRDAAKLRARKPTWARTARGYQKLTVQLGLRAPRYGIFLDPGMGKTSCCLEVMYQMHVRNEFKGAWVVCTLRGAKDVWGDGPDNERDNWQYPFTAAVVHGTKKLERAESDADIKVINWDGLDWLAKNWPEIQKEWKRKKIAMPDTLVIDESTKGKNHGARRSKALMYLCQFFKRITILTGTPTPKSMMDLWGQVYYLDGGQALGKYITQFRYKYFNPGKKMRNPHKEAMKARGVPGHRIPDFIVTEWELKDGAEEAIYEAISHMVIRFSDKLLGLKKPVQQDIYVDLDAEAMDRYLQAEEESIGLDDEGRVIVRNAGARTIRQRQIANGGIYEGDAVKGGKRKAEVIHQEKASALYELAEELHWKPMLVGFEFTHDRDRILAYFKKMRPGLVIPYIDGNVSPKDGSRIMAEFNNGEHEILLAQMGAVAHSVNLQKICHHICLYSMTYDLEIYIQFIKRVHRGGQKKLVHIYRLLARDTIDEDMRDIIESKDTNQKSLLARFEKNSRERLRRMTVVRGKRTLKAV